MQATEWEFRKRFFVIAAIFFFGFMLYAIDHVSVAHAFGDWMARHDPWSGDTNALLVIGAGACVTLVSFFIRLWGTSYLRAEVMSDVRVRTEQLVADGPYRYVRNPLYLGTFLLAVGMTTLASRIGALFLPLGAWVFFRRLIGREEAELLQAQGESYRQYLNAVPRLVPSLRPRLPSAGRKPLWGQALLGEAYILGFAISIASVAIRGDMKWYPWLLALSFVPFGLTRLRYFKWKTKESSGQ